MERYFPQGIAKNDYFCNREKERNELKNCMLAHEHIVLVAPRRYGKTSLISHVIKENQFPGIQIDFFFVLNQLDVAKLINESVSKLISLLLPKAKSACHELIDSIARLNPKLTFNLLGQKLEINVRQTPEKSIAELLLTLDHFAQQLKKPCVIVFDEFQQVGEIKENHTIEAVIRHAVERSEYVSYIFCGSKRHLLNEMFSDKKRPLYHLCALMTLDRIESTDYYEFLNHMAKKKWKKILENDVIHEILSLTENHSYYVNALCRRLWRHEERPSLSDVRVAWDRYVTQQSAWIIDDLDKLTLNRRKLINALAYQPTNEPQGQQFSRDTGLNPSGIKKALVDLQKLDMIAIDKNNYYYILDPAVAYFIRQNAIK